MMNAPHLLADPIADQLHALAALVEQWRDEVGELRCENAHASAAGQCAQV